MWNPDLSSYYLWVQSVIPIDRNLTGMRISLSASFIPVSEYTVLQVCTIHIRFSKFKMLTVIACQHNYLDFQELPHFKWWNCFNLLPSHLKHKCKMVRNKTKTSSIPWWNSNGQMSQLNVYVIHCRMLMVEYPVA